MLADDCLREGRLDDALSALQDQVRKDPAKTSYRTFLFQMLCVQGQWERALTQLKVVGEMDAATLPMVQTYREAIRCELLRTAVFEGKRSPLVFGEPETWIALLIEALRHTASGTHDQAAALREQAFEQAPAASGMIDGKPFEWIADADPRLGPVLEVIVNGQYYWVPFHRIKSMNIDAPEDLRDVVWMPGQFVWTNGGQVVGLIPTRYPGSESDADSTIRLSRKTEWAEVSEELFLGRGQRMLTTDSGDFPLMDVRQLSFGSESATPAAAEPDTVVE